MSTDVEMKSMNESSIINSTSPKITLKELMQHKCWGEKSNSILDVVKCYWPQQEGETDNEYFMRVREIYTDLMIHRETSRVNNSKVQTTSPKKMTGGKRTKKRVTTKSSRKKTHKLKKLKCGPDEIKKKHICETSQYVN